MNLALVFDMWCDKNKKSRKYWLVKHGIAGAEQRLQVPLGTEGEPWYDSGEDGLAQAKKLAWQAFTKR